MDKNEVRARRRMTQFEVPDQNKTAGRLRFLNQENELGSISMPASSGCQCFQVYHGSWKSSNQICVISSRLSQARSLCNPELLILKGRSF